MKKLVKVYNKYWTIDEVANQPSYTFVYGDNDLRIGKGGQAIIRDYPNTIGIRTKKKPYKSEDSFYSDREYKLNIEKIKYDIDLISEKSFFGENIYMAKGGYGTGLAKLKEKAPKTYSFLFKELFKTFGYHNEYGKIYPILKKDKVKNMPMNYKHNLICYGQNMPGQFRKELLDNKITNTFDAIKYGYRSATSRNEILNKNDYVIFYSSNTNEKLLCIVTSDSNRVSNIDEESWSKLEGWDKNYLKLNPDTLNKYQFKFEYLFSI